MTDTLSKHFEPSEVEPRITERWLSAKAFHAQPDAREERFVVMMPLPNVTGALHMGHAMDNVMQDLLTRWHRMRGANTLWMPGTDHAGIATQAVVEKRLRELEGLTRHDIGREALVDRIWAWKDQYQARIVEQQRLMGCSCDWDRQRFTMDPVCARAVRYTFFHMFRDDLLYRGKRLVHWDCHLQTAVADDEVVHETVAGHFWHLRYPVVDPRPGEPDAVIVATTRPETMLGDTAVAVHPDPAGHIARLLDDARARLEQAREREREEIAAEIGALEARQRDVLPNLVALARMAEEGRCVRLPLAERDIPLIADRHARPELGSGCVKITPAHDHNDYQVWTRHADRIGILNILEPDGRLNDVAGPAYAGLDRLVARERVVEDLRARGLLAQVEEREIEIGHSDRSKTPVEPYLSTQWFVRMGDVEGGVVCGRGTPRELVTPGLAQAAIDAVSGDWRSPTGRKLVFHPDPVRYGGTYVSWLSEKRDWCVSRQLWWGHQIPVWKRDATEDAVCEGLLAGLRPLLGREDVCARVVATSGTSALLGPSAVLAALPAGERELHVCLRDVDTDAEVEPKLLELGLERDPDVLDTWFSSGLWPHSTLGWPDPETAPIEPGQAPTASVGGAPDALSYYYPGSCLVTGRDIITLWVARMVLMGLYNLGDLPFTDCFIHATIMDGKGERMSKSKGNGVDPIDVVRRYGADALRYVICELQTGMQDVRLPVQVISPFTGKTLELAALDHGASVYTYVCPDTGKEFDVLGMTPGLPAAELQVERFDVGRTFCTKLWNAARLVLMHLQSHEAAPADGDSLALEDRWILSRLAAAREAVHGALAAYNPAAAIQAARGFFWSELCDWYLELVKPRMADPERAPAARRVLAAVFDQVLRLLHPFAPFITEELWQKLGERAPVRGIGTPLPVGSLLVHARWPEGLATWRDAALEDRIDLALDVVREIRSVRSRYDVPPRKQIDAVVRGGQATIDALAEMRDLVCHMANLASLTPAGDAPPVADAATAIVRDVRIDLAGLIDVERERERLERQLERLRKQVAAGQAKLANERFVSRAPQDVVDAERARVEAAETELAGVEQSLAALG